MCLGQALSESPGDKCVFRRLLGYILWPKLTIFIKSTTKCNIFGR